MSLNAIGKILVYLRCGYRYDEAVFLANLRAALPKEVYADESRRHEIEQDIASLLLDYKRNPYNKFDSKEHRIADYFSDHGLDASRLIRLYHPSKIETYPDAQPKANGILQLGSPRTATIRNPMAMRALFRLRNLINTLLREGRIDRDTKIRIEFARGLNDANRRKAIEQYQREREVENRKYAEEIHSRRNRPRDKTLGRRSAEIPAVGRTAARLSLYRAANPHFGLRRVGSGFRHRAHAPAGSRRR